VNWISEEEDRQMALYKRGQTWWTDFSVNGQRYRQSLDTTDWREAQAEEKQRITLAGTGKLTLTSQQLAREAFSIAAARYIADGKTRWAARTIQTEQERSRPLIAYFGATELRKFTADSIRAYMAKRKAEGISNRTINRERDFLRGVLKRAKRWQFIAEDVRPLPSHESIGRALLPNQKLQLFKVASKRAEWQVARLAMTLAFNTTMRGCELRGLQWCDVDLMNPAVTVRRSKTSAGERVIPLNDDAFRAIQELRERSKLLFGDTVSPDWYVFPRAEGMQNPDATKPMGRTCWRRAWRSLTRAVQCPACGKLQNPADRCRNKKCAADIHDLKSNLAGLRFHDLRHHAITELAESQASDQTIRSIAGHVSEKMLEHYSHIRLDAKRAALDALSSMSKAVGYDTNHGTIPEIHADELAKLLKGLVDVGGLEPPASSLRTRRSPN
jgi:integrase